MRRGGEEQSRWVRYTHATHKRWPASTRTGTSTSVVTDAAIKRIRRIHIQRVCRLCLYRPCQSAVLAEPEHELTDASGYPRRDRTVPPEWQPAFSKIRSYHVEEHLPCKRVCMHTCMA